MIEAFASVQQQIESGQNKHEQDNLPKLKNGLLIELLELSVARQREGDPNTLETFLLLDYSPNEPIDAKKILNSYNERPNGEWTIRAPALDMIDLLTYVARISPHKIEIPLSEIITVATIFCQRAHKEASIKLPKGFKRVDDPFSEKWYDKVTNALLGISLIEALSTKEDDGTASDSLIMLDAIKRIAATQTSP